MKKLIKNVEYENYYSKSKENIDLIFTIPNGFDSEEDAFLMLDEMGYERKYFGTIKFLNMYFPVYLYNSQYIVVHKTGLFYRDGAYRAIIEYDQMNGEYPFIPFHDPMSQSEWNRTLRNWLAEFDPEFTCKHHRNRVYLNENCETAFACCVFDTLVPLRELNCLDECFDGAPPSRQRLWERDIARYNPFNHACVKDSYRTDLKTKIKSKK